ncbi:MAG: hypothetical protein ACRCZF_14355 [Gemmataceae bacterium]
MSRYLKFTVLTVILAMPMGCNPMALSYFLFRGDSKAPAEFPLTPPEGKKETTVALLVSAPNVSWEFAGVDREIASLVAKKMQEQTKSGKNPFKVIEQSKIDAFKKNNPNWKIMGAGDLGKQLKADYVIELNLANISLYEPGTGKLMYMGQATIEGTVYDVITGKDASHYFVNPKLDSRPSSDILMNQYKAKLLDRVADEVTWKHVAHENDKRIAPAQ